MHTQHVTKPVPDCTTLLKYDFAYDFCSCVLSDQATIVGVGNTDSTTIFKENIADHSVPVVSYAANTGQVNTLVVDEPNDMLFAGSSNHGRGQVMQYDLTTGQAVKNYDQIGIGSIQSSTRIGNIYLFGGFGSYQFAVIDSAIRRVVYNRVSTAIWSICSLETCYVQNKSHEENILLFVTEECSDYTFDRTDVFDITGLVNTLSISSGDSSGPVSLLSQLHARQA